MSLYLVTGGAGFIGSHLCEELARRGERVRVADSLITGKRANLAHVPGVDFIEGDLADLAVAERAVQGVDYVLHQAAIPSVPRSVSDPITSNRANIDATLNVLVAARDAGVKRLVYAGSSSAYGDTPTLPKHEEMPTRPLSPYALQKLVGEQYLRDVHQAVRPRHGHHPLLQRLRAAPGSRVAVLGRHLAVHQRARGRAPADHLRRRRADAGFHLRRQRRGRRAARVPRAGHRGPDDERRDGGPHQPQRTAVHPVRPARCEGDRRVPRGARGRRARLAGRHRAGEEPHRLRADRGPARGAARRRWRGTDRRSRHTE